jgi:hypothetical protein
MKTQVVSPLLRNGDVEGQYNLYVDWAEISREIVSRETHGPKDPETGMEAPGEEIEDMAPEEVIEGFPVYEVLHDPDVLVLPATADSVDEALACGGSVTIVRRWSKAKVEQMADAGNIRKDEARELKENMGRADSSTGEIRNTEKRILEAVGIKHGGKEAQVWETWAMLPLGKDGAYSEKGRRRLCRVFYGPKRAQLGAKRNPYWNDRCPLLSRPVMKMSGAFKGPSPVSFIASLQYEANDALNEGADAATLSAAPIVRRDPAKSDGPLVYNVGAVWDGEAGAIELLTFPDLTPRAMTRAGFVSQAIMQNLSVNPSMLPQQTKVSKSNQAEVAQQQAVDLLTAATRSAVLEEGILTPAAELTVDFDYQFRDRDLVIRMYGEEGRKAEMQQVPPLQNRAGFTFVWRGGEQVRQNMAMQQGGTAMLNVMITPQMQQVLAAQGLRFAPGKLLQQMITNALGSELGAGSLVDLRMELTNPPEMENEWMNAGIMANVHALDDDNAHMRAHFQAMQESGDPAGLIRPHMMAHQQQAAMKMQAAMQQQMMQQQQGAGAPGGGRPPGASAPQPGASPAGPRLVAKQPPGAIHSDRMPAAGGIAPPRKF